MKSTEENKKVEINKYGREMRTAQHKAGEMMVTSDGTVYRLVEFKSDNDEDTNGLPCKPTKCAFALCIGSCVKPNDVESCTFVNRFDDKNVYFKKIDNIFKLKSSNAELIAKVKRANEKFDKAHFILGEKNKRIRKLLEEINMLKGVDAQVTDDEIFDIEKILDFREE